MDNEVSSGGQECLSKEVEEIRFQKLFHAYLADEISSSDISLVDLIRINHLLSERNKELEQIYEELLELLTELAEYEEAERKVIQHPN